MERPVGVVGAGVMGSGVAQALAQAGHGVVLVDVDQPALDRASDSMRNGVRMAKMLRSPQAASSPDEVLSRIESTTDPGRLSQAFFVIENVPERIALKEDLYRTLDEVCPPDAVLAANTSCVPIRRLAACTSRADRVLGMHFMNPAPMKDTVEVIRGDATSDDTMRAALDLLTSMGKEAVVVRDSPGFVSNRVLMVTINEASRVLEEGVAPAEDVDRVFTACFGHAMGPLATADLIGLDTIADSLDVLRECFGDDKYVPTRLLSEKVSEGKLGRKSGEGFFVYRGAT
ncbi:MAG TPA: 3-hydroxyacyl-CoA dehydrogenase family protein [Actinomycetota bacterium]|nr:3-hydroxyacyl-CoA dehydrogenase family protein [Actinomycetota bacterium]